MMNGVGRHLVRLALVSASTSAMMMAAAPASAQLQARQFDIPAQPLSSALLEFSRQSDVMVLVTPEVADGKRSRTVRGSLRANEAIARLLAGTGLRAVPNPQGGYTIERDDGGAPDEIADADVSLDGVGGTADDESIVVTGSRIRGARSASPVIEVTEEEIRDAGFSDLGQVIRSLPQNFSGGQNPGVTLGSGGITNQNISSGSALNLRGLGPDATLTLLNGRRLSYNGFVQAVDVSLVPIGALSRIEIVADGASAIYGSDAVAGVANIILKRDFEGLDTLARLTLPTDGGGEEYQLSATGGTTWARGGVIAAYEYTDSEPILSSQRAYTEYQPDPSQIYPGRRQHSALISGHHDFADFLEFRVDALYTQRYSPVVNYTAPGQRFFQDADTEIFVIAPSFELSLAGNWAISVGGSYARDETVNSSRISTLEGALLRESRNCYCNSTWTAEIDAEGPLFALPGGDVRMAVGAGYRRNEFLSVNYVSGSRTEGARSSRYAFGELYVPIIGPDQGISGINRLTATAALRYEDYGDIGDIATPKLGLIYEPTPDFALRGTWGRSFKTPTLLQQFSNTIVYLYQAETLGGTAYPPGSTVLVPYGGNPDLKPEKAETISATFSVHPRALPGLRLELSWFHVDYRDRVLQPIANRARTLIDPAYAEFVLLDPSAQLIADAVAASATGITNFANVPFDPANVVAIAYNRYVNVARSKVSGLDATASWRFDLAGGSATLSGSATWLDGSQQNSAGQAEFQTVGLIYNPPEFSARGGIVWERGGFTAASFVNHVGSVTDNTRVPELETGSFTTVDANIRYRTAEGHSLFSNLEVGLAVRNLFDEGPPLIPPLLPYAVVNYDSTNYSAIGRVVSLTLRKMW